MVPDASAVAVLVGLAAMGAAATTVGSIRGPPVRLAWGVPALAAGRRALCRGSQPFA
jgi:hypothetical protein